MSEKKKRIILFCYFVFVGVVCVFSVLNHEITEFRADTTISQLESTIGSLEAKIDGLSVLVSTNKVEANRNTISDYKYLIKEQNGKVALFSSDGTLLREVEIPLRALPQKDREMLANGIKIKDDAELYSLIQDYIG